MGWKGKQTTEDGALEGGLGTRLVLDDWGTLMRVCPLLSSPCAEFSSNATVFFSFASILQGQEEHFRDQVHPLPLPGSFLWGNMILQQLKQTVDEKAGKAKRILEINTMIALEQEAASHLLIPTNAQIIESRSLP